MDEATHHAFISYARVDDEPFDAAATADPGRIGWVSTFVDRLRKHLGRELGRKAEGERVWLDYEQLRGGECLRPEISTQLAASRLLVPILSPGWFASGWCRDELTTFLAAHPNGLDRLFPVWMERVERADLPTEAQGAWDTLHQLIGCRFWYLDQERQRRTRWFPHPDPTDRDYGDLQQDLARQMARRIGDLTADDTDAMRRVDKRSASTTAPGSVDAARSGNEPVPGTVPRAASTLQDDGAGPIRSNHLILVNGGSADADRVRAVAECLNRRHGLGFVIPLMAQPGRDAELKPSDLRRDLRDNLRLCTAVLMVFCAGPVHQVHEQLRECLQAAARPRKDGRAPTLDLCHGSPEPITFRPPGMRVHEVGETCTEDCVCAFVAGLGR